MTSTLAPPPVHRNQAPTIQATAPRPALETVRSLPGALKSEWVKATTIRSNKMLIGLTVGVGGFVSWAVVHFGETEGLVTAAEIFTFATIFTAVFAAIGGILLFSSEAQHGTLAPTLTAQPSRSVLATAKTVIAAGFGALLGIGGLLAGLAGTLVEGVPLGDVSFLFSDGGRAVIFTVLASILGLGIGMIARHSAAAISGLLVWWLVLETLLSAFVAVRFARFLPFVAGNGLLSVETGPEQARADLVLTTLENGLVFGAYALVAVVIGTIVFKRRDNN